jgi:diacylglycerol kinase (ATP)
VVETANLGDLESLATRLAIEAASSPRPRPVILAGGDGSYSAGVSALARAFGARGLSLPPIAFAPGGTVSRVAKNWGMPRRDPAGYARRLLDAVAGGTAVTTERPTLRVRFSSAERPAEPAERIGFIVGSGLVARFFAEYEAAGAGGTLAAAPIVARIFAGSFVGSRFARRILEPAPCAVTVDGELRSEVSRVSLVCASVVPDLGLGLRLLYRAGPTNGRFHVVATPLPTSLLGPQMPLVLAGRPLLGPKVDALAARVTLDFPGGTGAFVLDGELVQADSLEITVGPTFPGLSLA